MQNIARNLSCSLPDLVHTITTAQAPILRGDTEDAFLECLVYYQPCSSSRNLVQPNLNEKSPSFLSRRLSTPLDFLHPFRKLYGKSRKHDPRARRNISSMIWDILSLYSISSSLPILHNQHSKEQILPPLSKMQPSPSEWNNFYNSFAQKYETQSAGVTRALGHQLLLLLPPITPTSIIHDNVCGPSIITTSIIAQCTAASISPPEIYATDFNKGMVDVLKEIIEAMVLKR